MNSLSSPPDFQLTRKSIKNIYLRINPSGQVEITAPLECPLTVIERFFSSRQAWIARQKQKLQPVLPVKQFIDHENHYFLGVPYPLLLVSTNQPSGIHLKDNILYCYSFAGATWAEKNNLLKRWYQEQMQEMLPALIKKWEPVLRVEVGSWVIKTMKSRWGSCQIIQKKICLNLELIKKPFVALEYVLVHEMVHLLEASHNARFHALMTQFMPDWKIRKQFLV